MRGSRRKAHCAKAPSCADSSPPTPLPQGERGIWHFTMADRIAPGLCSARSLVRARSRGSRTARRRRLSARSPFSPCGRRCRRRRRMRGSRRKAHCAKAPSGADPVTPNPSPTKGEGNLALHHGRPHRARIVFSTFSRSCRISWFQNRTTTKPWARSQSSRRPSRRLSAC